MSESTQDPAPSTANGTRTIRVEMLSRVEGEGRFHLRVKDGEVQEATLTIFEPPRFFETFLVGTIPLRGAGHRSPDLRHLPGDLPDDRPSGPGGHSRHHADP